MNLKLIETIRKILSKTEAAGCTPAEAEAAFAMASRFLAEHNLTMDDVAFDDPPCSWAEESIDEMGRWTLEHNLCYGILKSYFFVEGYLDPKGRRKSLCLFGKPENVATTRHVWAALHAAFDRHWKEYRARHGLPASERRLFVSGIAKGFSQKLKEEREAQEIERDLLTGRSGGTALALRDVMEQTSLALKQRHKDLKKRNTTFAGTSGLKSTLEDGVRVGRSLNLNKAIEG